MKKILDQLLGEHKDSFESESSVAEVEEILETRAQQLHHHHIEVAFDSEVSDMRYTH